MKLSKLSFAVAVAAAGIAGAAQADGTATGPTLLDVLNNSGITVSGVVDTGYTYQQGALTTNGFNGSDKSSFNFKQAELTIAKQPTEGFGGLVNITAGRDAGFIRSYPYAASSTGPAGTTSAQDFDVTQAYAQYASGKLTAILGKYATLVGAEVINPASNTNITRSIGFYFGPYTHTGARVTYAANSQLSLIAGLNNGWDQQSEANGGSKTVELGFALNPSDKVSLLTQAYIGDAAYNGSNLPGNASTTTGTPPVTSYPNGGVSNRTIVDSVLTVKPTSKLSLVVDGTYGHQGAASVGGTSNTAYSWNILAGYVNYQWTDMWRTSLRLETFSDPSTLKLAEGVKRRNEATFTVGYAPTSHVELRGELRNDWASHKFDTETDSTTASKTNYMTAAFEALYKF